VSSRVLTGVLDGVAVGTGVAFGLDDRLNVGVVVAVDVTQGSACCVGLSSVHPATKTVANIILTINTINKCFFHSHYFSWESLP